MSPGRPHLPSRPCPACGKAVDPLRAPEVLLLDEGFRFLCSAECRVEFRAGKRAQVRDENSFDEARQEPPREQATAWIPGSDDPPPRSSHGDLLAPTTAPEPALPFDARQIQIAGFSAALAGLLFAILPGPLVIDLLSLFFSLVAAAAGYLARTVVPHEGGGAVRIVGPLGVGIAGLAALLARISDPTAWVGLAGTAIAAGAIVLRSWLDARAWAPVDAALNRLLAPLPETVRAPLESTHHPLEMRTSWVDTTRIRTSEEVVAVEGEVVAVDGVVRNGEAWAYLHAGTETRVRRSVGDPLMAGARIVEGSVKLVATRVGEDRALARTKRFGDAEGPTASRVARLAGRLASIGTMAVLVGAVFALGFAEGDTLARRIAAAAAVLLAAPLLSIRRAVVPSLAAAIAGGQRGTIFHTGATLEAAGRCQVAAFCAHGTLTEGHPEVLEVHSVDGTSPEVMIALAAGAEAVADTHPIARAILRCAEARGIAREHVRRAAWIPGRGITALGPQGEPLVIGNRQLLLAEGVSVAVADAEAARAEAVGHTAVFLGIGGRVRGVFVLQDAERIGARAAVQRVFDLGIEAVLLSGDHRGTVESIARTIGLSHVKAELLPSERGLEVRRLAETAGRVAVIGRPGNDDDALAAADVPILMAAAGGPVPDRGVAIAGEDVRDAAEALFIARAARTETLRILLAGVAGGGALVTLAAFGFLSPAVAAVLSVGVDAYVLPSGIRLLRRIALRIPARG